jgi:transposase InsO family protein
MNFVGISNPVKMESVCTGRLSSLRSGTSGILIGRSNRGYYQTRQEAKRDIQEYIEIFYNRQRKQKKLGYLSPAAFERRFYQIKKAA